jgi:hypothetical protein
MLVVIACSVVTSATEFEISGYICANRNVAQQLISRISLVHILVVPNAGSSERNYALFLDFNLIFVGPDDRMIDDVSSVFLGVGD